MYQRRSRKYLVASSIGSERARVSKRKHHHKSKAKDVKIEEVVFHSCLRWPHVSLELIALTLHRISSSPIALSVSFVISHFRCPSCGRGLNTLPHNDEQARSSLTPLSPSPRNLTPFEASLLLLAKRTLATLPTPRHTAHIPTLLLGLVAVADADVVDVLTLRKRSVSEFRRN